MPRFWRHFPLYRLHPFLVQAVYKEPQDHRVCLVSRRLQYRVPVL